MRAQHHLILLSTWMNSRTQRSWRSTYINWIKTMICIMNISSGKVQDHLLTRIFGAEYAACYMTRHVEVTCTEIWKNGGVEEMYVSESRHGENTNARRSTSRRTTYYNDSQTFRIFYICDQTMRNPYCRHVIKVSCLSASLCV